MNDNVFILGEEVIDDLTRSKVIVIKVDVDKNGNIGYFVNNDYLGGGRHPWELTKIGERNVN